MFSQSMTAGFLKKIGVMAKESFMLALFMSIFGRLKNDFNNSCMLKIMTKIVEFIKSSYDASAFKRFVDSSPKLHDAYRSSLLCAVICFVFSLITKLAGSVFGVAERLASGGMVHGVLKKLSGCGIFAYHNVFALLIGIMIVCPHELWNNLYALVFALGLGTWFLIRVYRNEDSADFGNINFGLVIFILFASVISLLSMAKADAVRIMLFVYTAVVFGLLMGKTGCKKENIISMLKILCTAVAVTAVVGIIQRFMGVEVNPEYVDVETSGNMPGRVFSTFANPNNFAELLVLFMPLTAALVMILEGKREKYFFAVCFALDFVAIGMSYSRSCWIALALALVVMILVFDWKLLVPVLFIAILAIPFLPESILNRFLSIGSMQDSSNAYRLHIWSGAIRVIKNYFVSGLGAGPENFRIFYRPLADFESLTAPHSHMIYMELVIEFGIFAAMGFFYYLITLMRKGFSAIAKADKKTKMILTAALGSMVGMLFVCMAEYVWFYPRDMFVFWVVMGVIAAATSIATSKQKN